MSQEFKKPGSTTGATGTTCTKTGLYKATDGKIEFVLSIRKGATFPKFPTGNSNTFWTAVGSSDASRDSYTSVLAPAGSI